MTRCCCISDPSDRLTVIALSYRPAYCLPFEFSTLSYLARYAFDDSISGLCSTSLGIKNGKWNSMDKLAQKQSLKQERKQPSPNA